MHSSFNSKFMKHIILSFLLLLSFSGWATTDTVKAKSTITGVNVFYNGAQIVRKVDFKAGKGDHLLVIENLTADLDPQSIQVGKFEGGKILSVKHELQYPSPSYQSKEEKELEASIDAQEMKIKEMKNKIQVYDLEQGWFFERNNGSCFCVDIGHCVILESGPSCPGPVYLN